MSWTHRFCACLAASFALALGCDDSSSASDGEDGSADTSTSGEESSTTDIACGGEAPDDYLPGMSKMGEFITVVLEQSVPAPPTRGDNTWDLEILLGPGDPLTGAAVTVQTWMPCHGHGSPVTPIVTEVGDGHYRFEQVNLHMAGVWTVTINVASSELATGSDSVTFTFVVD